MEISAEIYSTVLTIRSADLLRAFSILEIIERVADFYRRTRAQGIDSLGVDELHILWGLHRTVDGTHFYESGVVVDLWGLDLLEQEMTIVDVLADLRFDLDPLVPADEYEHQDNAREYANDVWGVPHTLAVDDEDWYTKEIDEPGRYVVETHAVPDQFSVDTKIDVISGNYTVSDDDSGERLYSKTDLCAGRGTIYVRVVPFSRNSGFYQLTIHRVEGEECSPDRDEPDQKNQSKVIDITSRTVGSLYSAADIDWFKLDGMSRNESYSIVIHSRDANVRAELRAGDKSLPLEPGTQTDLVLRQKANVYLRIEGDGPGEYEVSVAEYLFEEL